MNFEHCSRQGFGSQVFSGTSSAETDCLLGRLARYGFRF